jgi:hypothetical protein
VQEVGLACRVPRSFARTLSSYYFLSSRRHGLHHSSPSSRRRHRLARSYTKSAALELIGMFQMRYPYSPLGEKKVFLHSETMSGLRFPSSNDIDPPVYRGHLEARDMNASSLTEIDRPHEYVREILQPLFLESFFARSHEYLSRFRNDVLMGRGGKVRIACPLWIVLPVETPRVSTYLLVRFQNNQHSGNEKLRQIAKVYCAQYNESSKKEKSSISRRLVEYMRDLEPPARYVRDYALEMTHLSPVRPRDFERSDSWHRRMIL